MAYHRFCADLCLGAACTIAFGCGENDKTEESATSDGAPNGIEFGEMGSLSAPSGRGGFRFGASSAATQIEDLNQNTDWYIFTLPAADGGLGKGSAFVGDASLGYTKAIDDVSLLTGLHVESYRFSMEWARIEPQRDVIDETALAHYDAFIDALVAAHIKPNVTIHHFSNPIWIDDPRDVDCVNGPSDTNLCGLGHPTGGPEVIAEMAEHARLLAERYGDRVDEWATVNEPVNYLLAAYGVGTFPPGKSKLGDLLNSFVPVVRDYLAAHAAMYKAIKEADTIDEDGDGIAASVGLTLSVAKWEAARDNLPSTDPQDVAARDKLISVFHYLFPDALTTGTFDADLDGVAEEQHPDWANTVDWLGLQYYFRAGVTGKNGGVIPVVALTPCFSGIDGGACLPAKDPTFCVPTMNYESYAPGFYDVMMDFANRYPALPFVVSETGIATEIGERRAQNVVRTLEQIEKARKDGADVRGYYHWSLYDNFEWTLGFVPRFGLYRVDYAGSYDRTPTLGANVLGAIAKNRLLTPEQSAQYGGDGPMTPEGEQKTICGAP